MGRGWGGKPRCSCAGPQGCAGVEASGHEILEGIVLNLGAQSAALQLLESFSDQVV
jgi:hypothetical protein